jgi:hypothetical protein
MTEEFNCFAVEKLNVSFICPYCGTEIEYVISHIPTPNFEGDSFSTTCTDDYDSIECDNCHHIFDYTIQSSSIGGFLHIEDLTDDDSSLTIEEIGYEDYEDAVLYNTKYYRTFEDQIENIKKLCVLKIDNDASNLLLNNLLFANIITTLETYLSDALITTVLGNENYFIKFVETYKDFNNRKIELNKIYETISKMKDIVKKELLGLLYHNIPKISGIYKDTFDIVFPDYSEIAKLVSTRHDLIHRNGKDKDGNIIIIKNKNISEAIDYVKQFIDSIEEQMDEKIS